MTVLMNRLQADKARDDTRSWVKERRERTRHLIELGGLVQKSGLVALLDDDRATILGALLELAESCKQRGIRKGMPPASKPSGEGKGFRRSIAPRGKTIGLSRHLFPKAFSHRPVCSGAA